MGTEQGQENKGKETMTWKLGQRNKEWDTSKINTAAGKRRLFQQQ